MERELILAIEGGTKAINAGVFDVKGNLLAKSGCPIDTFYYHPGWAEQKPAEWWEALKKAVVEAVKKSGADKNEIKAMSLGSTCCTVILCKKDGTPTRNAMTWMDVRASEESKEITAAGHPFLAAGLPTEENMPTRLLWVKKNEPEVYNETEVFGEFQDYIMFKLTGKWVASATHMSRKWHWDPEKEEFPAGFYETAGLPEALDRFPKEIIWPGHAVGKIDAAVADELGISRDILLAQAPPNTYCSVLGTGVAGPGVPTLVTGSSHSLISFICPPEDEALPKRCGIIKNMAAIAGGLSASCAMLDWFLDNFAPDIREKAAATGEDPFALMDEEAKDIPVGAEGLIVLDYFQGNRSPYRDPNVRGMIYGLSLNHTRAHIWRALIEGIAYGMNKVMIERTKTTGEDFSNLIIGGTATRSRMLLEAHANVSNITVKVPTVKESPMMGAAMCAAVGMGKYKDIPEAAKNMVSYNVVIKPDAEAHEKLIKSFEQYEKAYPLMKDWMHDVYNL